MLQAASKTNDTAGDGTTTATILSAAIIAEGMKIVAAGTNPVQLTRGIEKTVTALVKELQGLSTDVSDADLANVATVSAGGDETVRIVGASRKGVNGGPQPGLKTQTALLVADALCSDVQGIAEQLAGEQQCWVACVLHPNFLR